MHRLDDTRAIRALDRSNMYEHIASLPERFGEAWNRAVDFALPAHFIRNSNIVFLGMGGSAIGGALVKSILEGSGERTPIHIVRDYTLPDFVDRNSLVVAVSYSGNTEETIAAFSKAATKGAKLLAVTSGGELERLSGRFRAPLFSIPYAAPPRAALAYLFVPLLAVAEKLGLTAFSTPEMTEVIQRMSEKRAAYALEMPIARNPAKKLAEKLAEKIVTIVGSGPLTEAARRWKTQLNENAKQAAYFEVLPELCHNSVVGLDFPKAQKKDACVVVLQSRFDHPRNILRMSLYPSILARKAIPHEVVKSADAPNAIAELAETILLGDFVSFYLAMLNRVDPTPVEPIEQLNKELARHQ